MQKPSHLTMISQSFAGTIFTLEAEAIVYFLMLLIIFDMEVGIRKFSCMGFVFGGSKTGT